MFERFIEAESFPQKGGWLIDQQSMETIHSAYLMAHGMGVPVADATTTFTVPEPGNYTLWALTRDWTAVWALPEAAGRFQLLVDGEALPTVLGVGNPVWGWQAAGRVHLAAGEHTLALHDLTGFNGRCDAVYITDSVDTPSDRVADIDELRRLLSYGQVWDMTDTYDLVVVGGGVAGVCTALSALAAGVKTLLVQDRPVLGGCNSSEVRVCMGGQIKTTPYERLGDVVRLITPIMGDPTIYEASYFEDDRKLQAFRLFGGQVLLNEAVTDVEREGDRVTAIVCTHIETGRKTRIRAALFADCSGDGVVARRTGATLMYGRESRETYGERLAPEKADRLTMGQSIRWYATPADCFVSFPSFDWGLDFDEESYFNTLAGDWEQETGFTRDMVEEAEYIRDYGLRAIYANWAYQKQEAPNKERFANMVLRWVSPIGGKREGYRVKGDYVLTQADLDAETSYDDPTAAVTWGIDFHFPDEDNRARYGEAFRSFAYHKGMPRVCPVPYRCLYAAGVDNLFIGGRLISSSHVAFSAVRVMRTLGMLGEVTGMAAAICEAHACDPRVVYTDYLEELKARMEQGVNIPDSFAWAEISNVEKYHFKDLGWFFMNDGHRQEATGDEEAAVAKFKRCVSAMGLEHTYPMPEKWR